MFQVIQIREVRLTPAHYKRFQDRGLTGFGIEFAFFNYLTVVAEHILSARRLGSSVPPLRVMWMDGNAQFKYVNKDILFDIHRIHMSTYAIDEHGNLIRHLVNPRYAAAI